MKRHTGKSSRWIQVGVALLVVAGAFERCGATLVFHEPFAYSPGSNLGGQGGWADDNTGDTVGVVSGNLSVDGLAAAAGSMVSFGGDGMDPYRGIGSRSTSTYYSAAFKITDLGSLNTTGGYVLGLASGASFAAPMWLRSDGSGGFNIGISKRASASVVWSSSSFSASSTIFVVGSYAFSAGAGDDSASLWINPDPATFSATAAPSGALSAASGSDSGSLTRFYFRQDDSTHTPATILFDELRIGDSWADVTPVPEPATWGVLSGVGMLVIFGLHAWRQERKARAASSSHGVDVI